MYTRTHTHTQTIKKTNAQLEQLLQSELNKLKKPNSHQEKQSKSILDHKIKKIKIKKRTGTA